MIFASVCVLKPSSFISVESLSLIFDITLHIPLKIVIKLSQISVAISCVATLFSVILLSTKQGDENMENLFVEIGELIATEIDCVEEVKYLDKMLGHMMLIKMKNGEKVLLSLIGGEILEN